MVDEIGTEVELNGKKAKKIEKLVTKKRKERRDKWMSWENWKLERKRKWGGKR